jgi:undecaprenyl-diphosphatase
VNIVNNFRGEQFGFISGHATNSFGLAMFVSLLFKNKFVTSSIFFWALLNSYSRIYLGVHFISDIVAGFFFGSILGLLVYELYVSIRVGVFKVSPIEKRKSIYSIKEGNNLSIGIILIIALIIILSPVLTSLSHSIIPESWS